MGERKTGLDYLRIFATLQVIMFHIYQRNRYGKPSKSFLFTFFCILSKTNNFHFMLISGYVGAKSRFLLSKTIPMILTTIFFSLLDYFYAVFFFNYTSFTEEGLHRACFPLAYSAFWYNLPYLVWQFIFSFIYPSLEKLKARYHFTICFIFLCIHCLPWIGLYVITGLSEQTSLAPFTCMAFIASFMRFHYYKISNIKLVIIYIVLFYYNFFVHQNPSFFKGGSRLLRLFGQTWILRFPSLIFSIPLFLISISYTKKWIHHDIIQTIAECSISVFMFHTSPYHIQYWVSITKPLFSNMETLWIQTLSLTFKTFCAGIIIEKTRQHIFNCLIFKRHYYQVLTKYINKIFMGEE